MLRGENTAPIYRSSNFKICAVSLSEGVTEGKALRDGQSFKCLSKYILY